MKKAVVVLEDKEDLGKEEKIRLDKLAKKNDAVICGMIHYPRGMILEKPEFFIEVVSNVEVDYVFTTSPEFVIDEILTDGKLSEMAKKENITIINTSMEMDIADIVQNLQTDFIEDISNFMNLKSMMDQVLDDVASSLDTEKCAMIITKNADSSEIEGFTDKISNFGYSKFAVVQMQDYIAEMKKALESVIQKEEVDKIFVVDTYESQALNIFLKQQEDKGIEVSYDAREEMNMAASSSISSMFMN